MTDLDSWRALAAERPGMAIYPEAVCPPVTIAADSLPSPAEGCGHPHDFDTLPGHHSRECVLEWCAQCDDPACDCECHIGAALLDLVLYARSRARRREAAEIRQAWRELRSDPTRLRIRRMHSRYPHRRNRNA